MSSTFTPALLIEEMATGDQSGTWGDTTNNNFLLFEQAITGVLSVAQGDTTLTLSSINGTLDQARNAVVVLTGAMTNNRAMVVPTSNKLYVVKNSTTGGFTVTVRTSGGSGVDIPAGTSQLVYCDGTNVVAALVSGAGTALSVAGGGTGLTSGTSGGILGFTASGVLASSVALTAHALLIGGGAGATPTPLASLGTTTTVLHGNAAGDPTYAAVSLTADVSGTLPATNGGTGITALGTGIATFLATPSSANLAAALTDATGTAGSAVFSVSPALTGAPTVPTASVGTSTTQTASTAFVFANAQPIPTSSTMAVGTFIIVTNNGSGVSDGSTIAGTSLARGVFGSGGGTLTGTWTNRNGGTVINGGIGYFSRTA